MKRYGKIFTFILFCLISFSGLMYGCAGKYDNVKVTSDKDESGLQLYIGEDTEGDMRSVGTITFYVEGLENGANNLKFNFEGYEESRIVKILNKSVSGNSVEVQLQAISGGSTKLVALTEAGMKYDAVQVDCIRRLENFSFAENYSPAMFNEVGSRLTLDTKKINFSPSDTTQNKVTYSVEPSIDGVDITAGGVLTLNQKVAGPINVFARSTENQSVFDSVLVHLIEPIENEDGDGIEIFTESNLYKDGKITLTSTGDESFIIFRVDVNTTENIVCTYKLENVSDSASGNVNCVNIEQNQLEFKARANDIGECKLVLSIGFADYDDAPVVEKEIAIKVVELPKTITVNDQTENFADNIYTYYENNKGKEYVVNIGEFRAYNKTFMLAISDSSLIEVKRNDGQKINFATFEDGIVSADGDILQSGQSIFVKGLAPNQTAKLYIIARGTVGFKTLLVREIGLNILLGSETVEPVERTFDGEPNSVYYVELGKSFELDYIIDENSSAYGIQLVKSDGGNLDGVVSAQVTEGLKPTITVTGTELGEISCKLLLENLIESHAFTIKVFKPVEYVDEEQNGGVYFFVDSPLENPNIASSEYVYVGTNKTLYSFVLSIGTTVQLKNLINPSDATIHNISYASYILRGENEPESGIEYLYVSDSGNVTARKMFPETVIIDEQEVSQKLAVYVTVESLATDENGDVIKITSTKIIYVEIYLPISDVKISKTQSTIYWNNGTSLNPVQVDAGVYSDAINLKVYSDAINLSKVHVNWDCPYALSIATNGLNATISAFDMPENAGEKSIYTVTATIQYYSTTIVRRCIFTVVKPTRASTLVAYINDIESDTAYFEFGENDIQPSSIDIQSAVYSASGKKDVTFDKVYFMSRNENVATVDENGKITPVGAGQTEIWVYAEDMMPSLYSIGSFKVIKVIVADGITKDTAIRIRNEKDFAKFMSNPNRFYYFSSDVAISDQYYVQNFEGNLDGNGYSLTGVKLDNTHTSMFGKISQDAEISNLNISASFDIEANSDLSIAGLAQTNKGTIDNVNIYFVKSAVKVTVENINVNIAGLVIQNDEFAYINASSVSANFEVLADAIYNIQSLNIGGLVATNNQSSFAYGTNQNYEYRPLSLIQEFDFSGSIKISQNVSAANSAIGGIFAINESNIYDQYQSIDGFASNIVINAPTINNVGGIVGINNGSIQNVLVEANIVANNNVGGIAGKSIGIIDNAIVEMYQYVSNQEISGKVQGNENVGGIVGYLQGLEDIQNSTYVNALVKNSYVFAYAEQSAILGNQNVGGIAGFAQFAEIEKSYAHTKMANGEIVGGTAGYAENLAIKNSFSIVDAENVTTFGSAVGKAVSNVEIVNFYSTSAGNMAGDGVVESIDCHIIENEITLESLKNINTYFKVTSDTEFDEQKTYYELQDSGEYVKTADTIFDSTKTYYENPWRISADNLYDENLNYYDWFISAEENDGYPILIYEGFLMRKLQPSQINIAPKNNIESTNNNVVVLLADRLYALSDVLNITTDVTSKASIYVYSNIDGILNTKNTTNLLSNRATLKSSKEQVITFTFVLGNNPSIREQIQIAFIQRPIDFTVDPVSIKLNQTIALNSKITFAENEVVAFKGLTNYKLGINESDITNDEIQISNAENLNGIILFDGDSLITGNAQFNDALSLTLYYKLVYFDLNGNLQTEYINIKNDRSVTVNVFVGATDIHISTTSIDMTLIDAVTFTVTLDTDDASDKLVVKSNASNSFISYGEESDGVDFPELTSSTKANSKLELSVIKDTGVQEGKLTVTFQLKFNDIYLDANSGYKFSQMFIETLNFKSKSNIEVAGNLQITAKPQNLLKIDLTNYAAGQKVGEKFNLYDNIPSNTLVPGQIGMLVVDIYPKYANYDEIQLISGVTSNGKAIKFVQMAKYSEEQYLEIRPNLNTIENGIILRQYSNVHFNENNEPVYDFDGRFYLNTIISSNVNHDEIVTITAIGITYVKDADGNATQTRQIIKTIDITVKPAPELVLTRIDADTYTAPVYSTKDNVTSFEEYNLVYKGQIVNFQVEQKNGVTGLNLNREITDKTKNTKSNAYSFVNDDIWLETKDTDLAKFTLKISESVELGTVINVVIKGSKNINGFVEEFESKVIRFLVVDFIIADIKVDQAIDGKFNINVNDPKQVSASIITIGGGDKSELEDKININEFNTSFWADTSENYDVYWNLNFANNERSAKKTFNNYVVYKTIENEYNSKPYSYYGILATSKSNNNPHFTVGFKYYYEFNNNGFELKIVPLNTTPPDVSIGAAKLVNTTVEMVIKISSNLDQPVTIYTVEDFYSMTTGTDYILMNDLYFGYTSENIPETDSTGKRITPDKYAETYTPFDLTANSFDGNMHKIHINGNCLNTTDGDTANYALFTLIANGSILKNLDIVYEDQIKIDKNSTLSANAIYFAGVVVRNSGVISNVYVYYNGDINITASNSDGEVYIAGFAYENSGKITYSSVFGNDFNVELGKTEDNENPIKFKNYKFASASYGNIAGFVGSNSDLISNCQVEFMGIENTAAASRNSKVSGFAIVNSGTIYNSSAAGQRVNKSYLENNNENAGILPLRRNETRTFKHDQINNISVTSTDNYFARLENNGNIAGFVYTNSGSIENAYSIFPMETQSRTAGFVFDNSNRGSVLASYTASFYDGTNTNNSAYAPFVGTDELGKVLNDSQNSIIRYCYYLIETEEIVEDDVTFKEPASRIAIESTDTDSGSIALTTTPYIGFDIGNVNDKSTTWRFGEKYALPVLNSNNDNKDIREGFVRDYVEVRQGNDIILIFSRNSKNSKAPYQIADALQFVNVFNDESNWAEDGTGYLNHDIRLINDIDLSEYAGTELLNKVRQVVYNGDFDGNGMTISGIKLIGGSVNVANSSTSNSANPYKYSSSSFGLFYQIGTATTEDKASFNNFGQSNSKSISNAKIRSLTLKVDEVSKSNSVFTGILAGVIVNTDIKSVKIQSNSIYVLGKNAVGGIAGGIFGSSTLYNVSVNANVTSSYRKYTTESYAKKNINDVEKYTYINYKNLPTNLSTNRIDFASEEFKVASSGYAGGVAGIIDLYQKIANGNEENIYNSGDYANTSDRLLGGERTPNINVVTVYGDVSMIGEIVGGLFGTTNEDTYIANAIYEVSTGTTQKLQGYYTAGGIIGITKGTALRLSKVEVAQSVADEYDNNLTNQTGNTLFDTQTYPFAIGGLVGIQRGGYLISSYSKTNVINSHAKYAGGAIGYLTNADISNTKNGRFVLLEEIYTTGNVFAGDGYDEPIVISSTNEEIIYTATPTSYVGGIIGCYKPDQSLNNKNYDAFNGVIGINAFHMPAGYTLPTTHKIEGTNSNVQYGDVMAGYNGTRKNAAGIDEKVEFGARAGAIFGEVISNFEVKYSKSNSMYNNLYTKFVYNRTTISRNDCINTNNNSGRIIGYFAKNTTGNVSIIDADIFNYKTQKIIINYEGDGSDLSGQDTYKSSLSYLVLRGYNQIKANRDGAYMNWADNWDFEKPIYPKFRPTNLLEYIPIYNEDDLASIHSGYKYKLMNDIYLTNNWVSQNQKDLTAVTLISAKRSGVDVTTGLHINNEQISPYYVIYNINPTSIETGDNFGFFKKLTRCIIKNVNFVFGTSFDNLNKKISENEYEHYNGQIINGKVECLNLSTKINNVGLLVGSTDSTSIEDCNIIVNSTATYTVTGNVDNFGVVVGDLSQSSSITNKSDMVGVSSGTISEDSSAHAKKNIVSSPATMNIKAKNIGGVVGSFAGTMMYVNRGKLKIQFTPNGNTKVGGVVGHFKGNGSGSNIAGNFDEIEIVSASGNDNSIIYAGGISGYAESLISNGNNDGEALSIKETTITIGENFKTIYIGGLFGSISSSNINGTKLLGKFTINSTSNVNEKYLGGLFGYASQLTSQLKVNSTNNNDVYINKLNVEIKNSGTAEFSFVGGLLGSINDSGNEIKNIEINLIDIENSITFTEENNVGGIAGYSSSLTLNNVSTTQGIKLKENSTTTTNNKISNIAGVVGKMNQSQLSNIKIDNLHITTPNNSKNLYVAGFVATVADNSDDKYKIESSYVAGDIIHKGTAENTYLAGFAGTGISSSNINSLNATQIINCVADVQILFTENDENVKIAGFAVEGFKTINNCASVGDIIFASSITSATDFDFAKILFTGKAAGFTCMGYTENTTQNTAQNPTINSCYSFSTMKLIGSNIYATSDTSTNHYYDIFYNYNLSGVFNIADSKAKFNNKDLNLTYSELLTTISDKKLLGVYPIQRGYNKLNPAENESENDNPIYYSFDNTYIANDSSELTTIGSFNVGNENSYLAGFTISSPIGTNSGYLFNCSMVGDSDFSTTGFVGENKGLINACGTNAIIDANGQTNVAGFVINNSGIIANSYATNIYKNQTNADSISGFVDTNSGYIYKSYASPAMFDLEGNYTNRHLFDKSNAFNQTNATEYGLCYVDNQTSSSSYSSLVTQSKTLFGKELDNTQNYGYATPYTYAGSYGIGQVGTGTNSQSQPYLINNFGRFTYFTSLTQTPNDFYAKLIIDIDANKYSSISGMSKENIYIDNSDGENDTVIRSIYRIKLSNNSKGLFNATKTIKLKNFGLKGSFNGSTNFTSSKGFLVGNAETLNSTNCYAMLENSITLGRYRATIFSDWNYPEYFGVFAGNITQTATITDSYATIEGNITNNYGKNVGIILGKAGTIIINNSFAVAKNIYVSGSSNVGALIGYSENTTISQSFAYANLINVNSSANVGVMIGQSGTTEIKESYVAGVININNSSAKVGGFAGKIISAKNLKDSWQSNMSYVVLKNYTAELTSELNVNAVVGLNMGEECESGNIETLPDYSSSGLLYNYTFTNRKIQYKYYIDHSVKVYTYTEISKGKITGIVGRQDKTENTYYYRYYSSLSLLENGINTYTGIGTSGVWNQTDGLFGSNEIIQNLLESGSLLNPIQLTNSTSVSDSKYYYLSSDISLSNSIQSNPAMIIGNSKKITISGSSALFENNSSSIVSCLTISNGALANISFDGYIFKVNITGTRNLDYGFVKATGSNSVFDSCTSNGTVQSNSNTISGFADTFNGGIFRSTTVDCELQSTNTDGTYYFSGLFNNLKENSIKLINTKISLKVAKPIDGNVNVNKGYIYIGGIKASIKRLTDNMTETYTLYGDIEFSYSDTLNQYAYESFIGGVTGEIVNSNIQGEKFHIKFNCVDYSGYSRAGGITGFIDCGEIYSNSGCNIEGIFYIDKFTYTKDKNTGECKVGGAIGWSRSVKIKSIYVISSNINVTTTGWIGGVIGIIENNRIIEWGSNVPKVTIYNVYVYNFKVTSNNVNDYSNLNSMRCLIGFISAQEFTGIFAFAPKTYYINDEAFTCNDGEEDNINSPWRKKLLKYITSDKREFATYQIAVE